MFDWNERLREVIVVNISFLLLTKLRKRIKPEMNCVSWVDSIDWTFSSNCKYLPILNYYLAYFPVYGILTIWIGGITKYVKSLFTNIYIFRPLHNLGDNQLPNINVNYVKRNILPK